MNKRADSLGSGIRTMYRVLAVIFVALVVLGSSYVFYGYSLNVRFTESVLLTRQVIDCFISDGSFDLSYFESEKARGLLDLCGIGVSEEDKDRLFVKVTVYDSDEEVVFEIMHGDSGAEWIIDASRFSKDYKKYSPGKFEGTYPTVILKGDGQEVGKIVIESLVKYEK